MVEGSVNESCTVVVAPGMGMQLKALESIRQGLLGREQGDSSYVEDRQQVSRIEVVAVQLGGSNVDTRGSCCHTPLCNVAVRLQ